MTSRNDNERALTAKSIYTWEQGRGANTRRALKMIVSRSSTGPASLKLNSTAQFQLPNYPPYVYVECRLLTYWCSDVDDMYNVGAVCVCVCVCTCVDYVRVTTNVNSRIAYMKHSLITISCALYTVNFYFATDGVNFPK